MTRRDEGKEARRAKEILIVSMQEKTALVVHVPTYHSSFVMITSRIISILPNPPFLAV
jgi:hypothetical protein